MKIKSLFNFPNIIASIYLYFGLRNTIFFQYFFSYEYKNSGYLNFSFFFGLACLTLAFFAYKKKTFPLTIFEYLLVLGCVVMIFGQFSPYLASDEMAGDVVMTPYNEKITNVLIMFAIALIYFICHWRYKKQLVTQSQSSISEKNEN